MTRQIDYEKIPPVCCRCGYRYRPYKQRQVLILPNDEHVYVACAQCIEELGHALNAGWQDVAKKIMASMEYKGVIE